MKPNIVLVIVDCLRYDYALKMPFLRQLGQELPGGYWFENHWATSHCTDPCMMHILSGKHPDELRLYSMMFNRKDYVAPDVPTIFHTANEHGYETAFITNLQRWYVRGVKSFVDSRDRGAEFPWVVATQLAERLPSPWLMTLHSDDCHTNYTEGSYAAACGFTDRKLKALHDACPRNTVFMVTSDHGEGLGQAGPDGKEILQHGYGLWDFLTHIPLMTNYKWARHSACSVRRLSDHGSLNDLICKLVSGGDFCVSELDLVFQAGATPKVFHRGVVDPFGRQFIRATHKDGGHVLYTIPERDNQARALEIDLIEHCKKYGINYGLSTEEEAMIVKRLKGLGYWSE